jgi:AbrB family looped-hinge helix DNA binding protein
MISTMLTTMDSAGRLVIPSEIRREAALEPGVPLEVRWRDGVIEIEPQSLAVTLKRKGRLLVASPAGKASTLRTATVERTRRDLATRRGGR